MREIISVGDCTSWKNRLWRVEAIDQSEFCHLVDCEGETAMVHRSVFKNQDPLVRDMAKAVWDKLCE
jgi:hypothetical protein